MKLGLFFISTIKKKTIFSIVKDIVYLFVTPMFFVEGVKKYDICIINYIMEYPK